MNELIYLFFKSTTSRQYFALKQVGSNSNPLYQLTPCLFFFAMQYTSRKLLVGNGSLSIQKDMWVVECDKSSGRELVHLFIIR